MSKTANAIIILYNGKPFTKEHEPIAEAIVETFTTAHIIDDVKDIVIKAKDTEGICAALLKDATATSMEYSVNSSGQPADIISILANNNAKKDQLDLLNGAIIIIGTSFAESLIIGKKTRNYSQFMRDLLLSKDDPKIRRAVEVIATSNAHTSKKILDEYRITPGAIETIRDANGTLQ
jgi:hypothetical protein